MLESYPLSPPLRRAIARLCLAAVCAATAAVAGVDEGAPAEALTWEQCKEGTQRMNPELLAAANVVRQTELSERSTYGAFFPALSASLGFGRSGSGDVDGPTTVTTGYTAGLTASMNLFAGFADRARSDEARARRAIAEAALAAARARISFDLKSTFAGLAYAQKLIRLTEELAARREANGRLIELRYDGGRENRGSLLLARTYVEQAKLDVLQAGNALAVSQAQMARVLGRAEGTALFVTGAVPLVSPPEAGDLPAVAKEVPEYRESVARERVAEAGVTIARGSFFPTFAVTAAVGRVGPTFFPQQGQNWAVGATITVPLFNGGRDYYATRSAGEGRKAAALVKENSLRSVLVKLRQAYSGYLEAVRRLAVDRQFVEAVGVRSRIAREKYNNGLMTFEDWDVIENDYIQRQKSLLASERDRTTAEASWEQAQGRGVFP